MPFADELLGRDAAAVLTRAFTPVLDTTAPEDTARDATARDITAPSGLRAAEDKLDGLSLRERVDLLTAALLADLPGGYDSLATQVRVAAASTPEFRGFLIWPVTEAVAQRAMDEGSLAAFDDAMRLLAELTPLMSSEFAIRTLLRHDLDRAIATITTWTTSTDPHVRRLASEGTRPLLPWATRVPGIMADPTRTIPILDALYRDESEDVRRSVANHLNDLSRNHGDLVVQTAARWLAAPDDQTPRVVRHGLRTLVKRGDPGALALLGFAPAEVEIDGPTLDQTSVAFGGTVHFTATVRNTGAEPARLAIDYVVHHAKANGTQTGKTFKLTTVTLAPGETFTVDRDHSFRAITTRRYHPGRHGISVQVNGLQSPTASFELQSPTDA